MEQSREVREAAESLIVRRVQAFWLGGDVTVSSAIDSYCDIILKAKLPLFKIPADMFERLPCSI